MFATGAFKDQSFTYHRFHSFISLQKSAHLFYMHEVFCLLLYFCFPARCGNVVKWYVWSVWNVNCKSETQKLRICSVAEITVFALFHFLWPQMCTHQQSSLDRCWRNLSYCVQNTSAQIHFQWECLSCLNWVCFF